MIDERRAGAATVSLDAFHHVWPRFFPLTELRALLGANADELVQDVLARQVSAPLWLLVDRGGKRWRTTIGRLAYRVAGGAAPEPHAVFEVPELLHNASLVVDDIEDAATERRGGPAAHVGYGVPVALNAANAAYFRALAVLRATLADAARLRALDMLSEELFVAHLGQALDLTLGTHLKLGAELRTAHYEMLARAKTGALVRLAARLGAIAADADPDVEGALAAWAGELGVAYQIRDDVDDLTTSADDLARGRLTYPLLAYLEEHGPAARARVERAIGAPRPDDEADGFLATPAVRARCRAAAAEAGARAAAALDALPSGRAREALRTLGEELATGGAEP